MLTVKLPQTTGPSRPHRYRRSQRDSDRRRPAPEGFTPLHRFQRALGLGLPIPAFLRLPIPAGLGSPIPASLKPPAAGPSDTQTADPSGPLTAGASGLRTAAPVPTVRTFYITNNFLLGMCNVHVRLSTGLKVNWKSTGKVKRRNFKPVLIFVEE